MYCSASAVKLRQAGINCLKNATTVLSPHLS